MSFLRKLRTAVIPSAHQRAFRLARRWSNEELSKFAHLFCGSVANVSAWEDKDKAGRRYRDYFSAATSYHTTNFGTDQGVLQGDENELFLDLEAPVPAALEARFDVVFNHTVLEHVFEFRRAFANLCALSSDIVILVVPWMQQLHANYGDYWRFSPQAVARLFAENGLETLYLSWTDAPRTSVYVFAIASKRPEKWRQTFAAPIDVSAPDFLTLPANPAGCRAL